MSRKFTVKSHRMVDGQETKHCYACDGWVAVELFHKSKASWDGLTWICASCGTKKSIAYRNSHPEKGKEWVKNNPDKVKASSLRFTHSEKRKAYWLHPSRNLRQRITGRMRQCLKDGKQGKHWETLVGYTIDDLQKRLSKTMPEGYTWDDLGKLHIDHIIPLSAFNITDENSLDFKRCWGLGNLRLLPKMENLMKKDRLDKPFQPSLAMGL